jgi:hypothetical protein
MQITVESCTSICVNTLQKTIKRIIDRDYPEADQDEIYSYTLAELRKFTVNGQYFEYSAQSNYLGGHRWFFLCPKCKNRANKLFLPPAGSRNKESKYLCKICHKLKNQSALMGQNHMYRKVTRPLKRLKEIEDKIARGHLKTDKVQDLLNEYEQLEKQLKESPEFRLYSFKKKHNLIA